jgi:hypothetical protein
VKPSVQALRHLVQHRERVGAGYRKALGHDGLRTLDVGIPTDNVAGARQIQRPTRPVVAVVAQPGQHGETGLDRSSRVVGQFVGSIAEPRSSRLERVRSGECMG